MTPTRSRSVATVWKWAVLGSFALVAAIWAPSIAHWWAQPIAVFFGRREFWWDAEDFAVFYAAGTLVADGRFDALYDSGAHAAIQMPMLTAHDEPLGFYNPPFFALFFTPFSWLPHQPAFQLWSAVNAALVVIVCVLLWRIAEPLDRAYRVFVIAAFLTLYPLTFALRLGQFSLILTTSWAAAYLSLRHGRERAAGLALTPLLIKPELLIPVTLVLAWKRRVVVLRSLVPVAAAAVVLSVAMVGPAGGWDYARHIASAAGDGSGNMYGWNGLLAATFTSGDPGSMTACSVPLAAVTLGAAAWLWSGTPDPRCDAFPVQWLVLTLATVLWDAHFYLQDVIIVAPAAVAVLASASGWRRALTAAAMFSGWVILGWGSNPSEDWGVNVFSIYMAACLAGIVVWTAADRLRARRSTGEEPPQFLSVAEPEAA
jgi:hypothetical protein